MFDLSGISRANRFKPAPPKHGANDNDDPDRDNSAIVTDPDRDSAEAAPSKRVTVG